VVIHWLLLDSSDVCGLTVALFVKVQEAISHCEQALRIRADFPEAHFDLGNAFLQEGEVQKAIVQYRLALKFRPDWIAARNALAQAQARQ
jgi:Flp pilus assembly protein TadD